MSDSPRSSSQLPGGDPFDGTPYRRIRPLGGGGMAQVYLVEHRMLGSEFAAKVLDAKYAAHQQLADRVRVEAQSLGRLEHPNTVQVTGYGWLRDGRPYLIMEALSGHTLESEIQARERLPLVEALRYGLQLTSALAAAHAVGIVHRDIKPDNLFVHHEHDGSKVLKVLDFGVARILPGVSERAPLPLAVPTDTGIVVGTPRYVSPEAALGKRVDHRADIYGVGLVLYIMLTGKGPFDHVQGERRILAAHVQQTPAPLSAHQVEGLSPELESVVSRALAKNPEDRFGTAGELEAALATLLQRTAIAAERVRLESPLPPKQGDVTPQPADAAARVTQPRDELVEVPAPPTSPPAGVPAFRPPARRSPAVVAAIFLIVLVLVGLACSGAVSVVTRLAGGQ